MEFRNGSSSHPKVAQALRLGFDASGSPLTKVMKQDFFILLFPVRSYLVAASLDNASLFTYLQRYDSIALHLSSTRMDTVTKPFLLDTCPPVCDAAYYFLTRHQHPTPEQIEKEEEKIDGKESNQWALRVDQAWFPFPGSAATNVATTGAPNKLTGEASHLSQGNLTR